MLSSELRLAPRAASPWGGPAARLLRGADFLPFPLAGKGPGERLKCKDFSDAVLRYRVDAGANGARKRAKSRGATYCSTSLPLASSCRSSPNSG